MKYYKKPLTMGGGGNTFVGWSLSALLITTAAGSYSVTVYRDSILINGTGNEVVNGTDSVKVRISVYQNNYITQIIN